jgi:ATP-dependent DNA helicase RecQ
MAPGAQRIRDVARERLGHPSLRPGQLEAVTAVLDGHDTLAVMSTGSGKSAIYQLSGLLLDGPTIVVSPLISLQEDQMDAVAGVPGGGAATLNSTLSQRERERVLDGLATGEIEFVLLAPEQLANDEVAARLAAANPSLLVVDEAHCVSQWGHDFRPEYLRLAAAARALGRPPILALTATAAPPVRADIVDELDMQDAVVIVRGFDRPEIRLSVQRHHEAERKTRALLDWVVAHAPGPGIVYATTQRDTEELAAALVERGIRAAAYHGGMPDRQREATQEAFMDDGEVDVMVATIAFGMGVDKPDVRFVAHHSVSESIDAYWQEVGRSGRDRKPAEAVLFYRPQDLGTRRFQASGRVDRSALDQVARGLAASGGQPVEPLAIAEEQRESFDRSRVEMMRAYAEHDGCRRAFVLGYFGEDYDPPCGNCDWCEEHADAAEDEQEPDDGLDVGARVAHVEWGEGTVAGREPDQLTVVFDSVGYRTLALALVLERGLLKPA